MREASAEFILSAPETVTMTIHARPKVLCVEDNDDECDLVTEILSAYDVVCVPTVAQGCSLVDSTKFALIVMDEHLPDGSGLELCSRLSRTNADTPVIIISGDTYITAEEAAAAGAKAFLPKSRITFVNDLRHLVKAFAATAG